MSDETPDPVFGTLERFDDAHYWAMVWLTPKHAVRVTITVGQVTDPAESLDERLPHAREQYLMIRQGEWEYRLATARYLGASEAEAAAEARRLHLTGVILWDNSVTQLFYGKIRASITQNGTFAHAIETG